MREWTKEDQFGDDSQRQEDKNWRNDCSIEADECRDFSQLWVGNYSRYTLEWLPSSEIPSWGYVFAIRCPLFKHLTSVLSWTASLPIILVKRWAPGLSPHGHSDCCMEWAYEPNWTNQSHSQSSVLSWKPACRESERETWWYSYPWFQLCLGIVPPQPLNWLCGSINSPFLLKLVKSF